MSDSGEEKTAVWLTLAGAAARGFVYLVKANVDPPPFFTVVAVLAGATLYGVVGALLALPLAAALRVYLKRLVVPAIQKK